MAVVSIVGAGMAGLTAGRELEAAGHTVRLYDKSRAVGGRMSTRRVDRAVFDHGAQHVSARSPAFTAVMDRLVEDGVARVWLRTASVTQPARGVEPRFAGVGGMRRIPEALATGLDVSTGTKIERLDLGRSDAYVVTPPIPQTIDLLRASHLPVPDQLVGIDYDACLAVMVTLDAPAGLVGGHLALDDGPVAWIADNQHKRASGVPSLTVHSTPAFAALHLEHDPDEWITPLLEAARPHHAGRVVGAIGHRWRYSQPRSTLDIGSLRVAASIPVVLAGEVFAGARVEGAFISGLAAAASVREALE